MKREQNAGADSKVRARHKRLIVAVVAVLLVILGLSWAYRVEPAPPGLPFRAGDSTISPLFVLISRGQPETNYVNTAAGMKLASVSSAHRFYCPNTHVRPVPALFYWVQSALSRLRIRGKAPSISMSTFYASKDTSVLWLGYKGTNTLWFQDLVLISDHGLSVPLTPGVGRTLTAPSEHLDCWQLPSPLTNRGTYRLTLPRSNQTILTFIY